MRNILFPVSLHLTFIIHSNIDTDYIIPLPGRFSNLLYMTKRTVNPTIIAKFAFAFLWIWANNEIAAPVQPAVGFFGRLRLPLNDVRSG